MKAVVKFLREKIPPTFQVYLLAMLVIAGIVIVYKGVSKKEDLILVCIYSARFEKTKVNSIMIHPTKHGECQQTIFEGPFSAIHEGTVVINTNVDQYGYRFLFHNIGYNFQTKEAIRN